MPSTIPVPPPARAAEPKPDMNRLAAFLLALLLALLPVSIQAASVNVFAAASLADAIREIAVAYQKEAGDRLSFNFAGSNVLARQIEEGAPADLFFSADEARMDQLEKAGRIVAGTRTNLLGNSLVVVVAGDSALRVEAIGVLASNTVKRIALADPQGVPAGVYAKQHLTKLGLWSAIAPKVVPTENVRAALAAVESGNVEAGIVYRTDDAVSKRVRVALEIPAEAGPRIVYPAALVKDGKESAAAARFLRHLRSEAAANVFRKHGFLVLP